jgi:hypothetical protein
VDRRCLRTAVALRRNCCLLLALAAGFPGAALAVSNFTPYADAAYEYNTNYFALASGVPEPLGSNGPTLAVGYERYKAGFESDYDWSQQEFFLNAEGRRLQYQDFGELDHYEYLVHTGLRWALSGVLDGVVDYQRERTQVSWLQFNATPNSESLLFLQVQNLATASVNLQFLPEWRLESLGKLNDLDSPRPGFPNLSVRELSIDEGIKYVGFANLSAGLVAEYLDGRYTSTEFIASPKYHQTSVDLAADYTLSGLSLFHGAVGYTNRDQEQAGSISGLTGILAYQRTLTGKTSVGIKLSRAINDYLTGAAPEIDSMAELDAVWNATSKIGVALSFEYLHSSISNTNLVGVLAPSRTDRLESPQLSVRYQARDWLSIRPYMQYQNRHSSDNIYSFTSNTYGVEVEARFGQPQPLTLPKP